MTWFLKTWETVDSGWWHSPWLDVGCVTRQPCRTLDALRYLASVCFWTRLHIWSRTQRRIPTAQRRGSQMYVFETAVCLQQSVKKMTAWSVWMQNDVSVCQAMWTVFYTVSCWICDLARPLQSTGRIYNQLPVPNLHKNIRKLFNMGLILLQNVLQLHFTGALDWILSAYKTSINSLPHIAYAEKWLSTLLYTDCSQISNINQ